MGDLPIAILWKGEVGMIFVTGCAGFIGSNFVHAWLKRYGEPLVNLDKLTYAGNIDNLEQFKNDPRHIFGHGDIGDRDFVMRLLGQYQPRAVINFAAESHVDRSIRDPGEFIQTNVVGTFNLLESVRTYWSNLNDAAKSSFRFIHVSTDEVFGSLDANAPAFTEQHPYSPNSPYSASKAAGDHMVRAWHHTYGLPAIITNCSNNYGPYHFPEKLIPLCISRALLGMPLPIYGDGQQVRDWLYVADHCRALFRVLESGQPGETYNIGGKNEKTNLEVVQTICRILDGLKPKGNGRSYAEQITFVQDRPGHDRRYAIDSTKIERELNWKPEETFESGIRKTVAWYLENTEWTDNIISGSYRDWIKQHYGTKFYNTAYSYSG